MPRTLNENISFHGGAIASGGVLEYVNARYNLTGWDSALLGLGVGALSIAGSMVMRNNLVIQGFDGAAAGSMSFVGGRVISQNLIFGNPTGTATPGAGGPLNRKAIRVNPKNAAGNANRNNGNKNKKVVSM